MYFLSAPRFWRCPSQNTKEITMVRIISDTSTMYSEAEGQAMGIDIAPLSVTISGESYRELTDIQTPAFIDLINQGGIPTSSQPSIGDVLDLYQKYPNDQILDIAMADGLSGTYNSACTAATMTEHPENITVINSKTLCGPHRYMVEKAHEMAVAGASLQEILSWLQVRIDNSWSYLMPNDFDYLRRGGRLSPLVASMGKILNLVPVMTLTEDCKQLISHAKKRSVPKAIQAVIDHLKTKGVDTNHKFYISHAQASDFAEQAKQALIQAFGDIDVEVLMLTPAFTTQGGPKCFAIQTVLK